MRKGTLFALTGLATLVLGCSSSAPKKETVYVLDLGERYVLKQAPVPDSIKSGARIPILEGDYSGSMQIVKPDTSYSHMPTAKPDD